MIDCATMYRFDMQSFDAVFCYFTIKIPFVWIVSLVYRDMDAFFPDILFGKFIYFE